MMKMFCILAGAQLVLGHPFIYNSLQIGLLSGKFHCNNLLMENDMKICLQPCSK